MVNNNVISIFVILLTCFSINACPYSPNSAIKIPTTSFSKCENPESKAVPHNYHVSITQIIHNPETASLEISMKLFTEDLEMALMKKNAPQLFLGEANEHQEADKYIHEYLHQNFSVSVNGEKYTFQILGKEVEMEETWCYLEVKDVSSISELSIKNTVFTELFQDQTNRINVKAKGQEKSLVLSGAKTEDVLNFN